MKLLTGLLLSVSLIAGIGGAADPARAEGMELVDPPVPFCPGEVYTVTYNIALEDFFCSILTDVYLWFPDSWTIVPGSAGFDYEGGSPPEFSGEGTNAAHWHGHLLDWGTAGDCWLDVIVGELPVGEDTIDWHLFGWPYAGPGDFSAYGDDAITIDGPECAPSPASLVSWGAIKGQYR